MTDAARPAVVALPWAHQFDADPDAYQDAAQDRVQIDARDMHVRSAGLYGGSHDSVDLGGAGCLQRMPTELRARGLPARPAPTLPESDRVHLDDDLLMSAAVALDVLASFTEDVEPGPDVLHRIAEVLTHVGTVAGIDEYTYNELLAHAAGELGQARSQMSRRLAGTVGENILTHDEGAAEPHLPSTPGTVVAAARRIEAMADAVVREAHLLLEAYNPVDYRQA